MRTRNHITIARAIDALPRRIFDRKRKRLQEAGPQIVAIFRKHSPVKTGFLRRSWRYRTRPAPLGLGWQLSLYAAFYWYYQNARGRNRGFARRAIEESRAVLKNTIFTVLPTTNPRKDR